MFVSLLQGNSLKSKGLELALLLRFQLTLTAETPKIDVKTDIQEPEKESIKAERDIQIKGATFVSNGYNVAIEDDEEQDPTYSPAIPLPALAAAYPCEKCGKYFKTQRSMEKHSKKHLTKEENH